MQIVAAGLIGEDTCSRILPVIHGSKTELVGSPKMWLRRNETGCHAHLIAILRLILCERGGSGEELVAQLFLAGRTGEVASVGKAVGADDACRHRGVVHMVARISEDSIDQETGANGSYDLPMPGAAGLKLILRRRQGNGRRCAIG